MKVTSPIDGHGAPVATAQMLLLTLRRGGPMSAGELAAGVGLGRSAVLERLRDLENAGMVIRRISRNGPGRPRHLFDVAARAQDLLPEGFQDLSTSLLEAARDVGGSALVERLFDARRVARTKEIRDWFRASDMDAHSLYDRTCELAALQDGLGFVCEVSREGALRFREHNCPILGIATRYEVACESEARMISDVLDADVRRESSLACGDRSCTYRIEPRAWDSRGWDIHQYYYVHTPTPGRSKPREPRG